MAASGRGTSQRSDTVVDRAEHHAWMGVGYSWLRMRYTSSGAEGIPSFV